MIVLIAGASHTGKTLLAQQLLDKYNYPYLSIDHLKMGLIRSGNTTLTTQDDAGLILYLWPIIREMIKTAIENEQDLVIEGCYIPFDWKKDFAPAYLKHIQYYCLIMAEEYIKAHFADIKAHAQDIEHRQDDSWYTMELALKENAENLCMCKKYGYNYILIENAYNVDVELEQNE